MFIIEYGGWDCVFFGWNENFKILLKFSNKKIIKLLRCLEDVIIIDNIKLMSWEKCFVFYVEICKVNVCDY